MQITQKKTFTFTPARLIIKAKVRYPEDATVNGVEDTEGSLMPYLGKEGWIPVIDIKTGRINQWPEGTTAKVHYKVCDAGEYWLEDDDGKLLKYPGHYVPDGLCPGGEGYGDYIIMDIGSDGVIESWNGKFEGKDWSDSDD